MDIADGFCKYFTNIGPNLASAIPTVNSATFRSFLGSRDYPPIILKPTDARELESICSLFSPRKAPGYDSRELTNRRLLHDDAVGLRDMSTAHAFLGTYRRRAKVDDVGESDLPAS